MLSFNDVPYLVSQLMDMGNFYSEATVYGVAVNIGDVV